MKIILVKEENGLLYEVAKIVYKNKPTGFIFKPSTQLDIIGKMITDETDKDKQDIIIRDFSYIKNLFSPLLEKNNEIIKKDENETRIKIINRYLAMMACRYGLTIIDLNKDGRYYELHKRYIYRRVKPFTRPAMMHENLSYPISALNECIKKNNEAFFGTKKVK